MGTHRSTAVVVASILLSFAAVAPFVHAQAGQGLEVKPAIVDDNTTPGAAYHFTVTVKNISPTERSLTILTKDISGLDDNGLPIFAPAEQETIYSLSKWIQVPQAPITLQAGESRAIPLVAQVPANANPGDHFGGVFFEYSAPPTDNNGSAVSFQVGDVINLQIAGDIVENARLREFSTNRILYGSPAVSFTAKVENLGNVLVRPRGLVEITDMSGKQVASLPVNDALAPVFPGAVRSYALDWKDDGFAIGRYQATLSLSYGSDAKRTISATTSFWVVPFKLAASIIGALLVIILVVYFWVRTYLRKQLKSMRGTSEPNSADAGYYGKKYGKSNSRALLVTIVALLLCVLLLAVLFVTFA